MQALLYDLLARSAPDVGVFADSDECSAAAGVALLQRKTPFVLPDFRAQKGDDLRAYHDELLELLAVLRAYHRAQGNKILIAPFHTLLYPLPSPAILQGFEIAKSQNIAPRALADKLVCFGYVHVDMIELSGEMSLRGDILDIYPPTLEPLRIEFFGDEIESIRPFDTTSQLSHKNEHTSLEIPPVLFALSQESYESLAESVRESPYTSFHKDIQSLGLWHLPASMCAAIALKNACVSAKAHEAIGEELELFEPNSEEHARLSRMHALAPLAPKEGFVDFTLSLSSLPTFLQIHSNKHITIIARNDVLLRQYNIDSEQYTICKESFCVQFMTPTELFLSLNAPIAQKKPKHKTRIVLDEIAVGDYIVHRDYGIGIFQGISQEKVLGALRDFILLQYQGEDRLLLPVENLDMIDRYIADSGSVPIVDTLGNKKFARLKEKVRTELLKIAQNIIDLAAKRTLTQGMVFDVAAPELALFQAQSGFSYTDDQQSAIAEIFADLSSGNVMDRLLSGDVGFGKTEVAMNAIFVAHKSGAQSALLVPTTLLA
ncbi:MAG: transcription-repair coupling factor, partial [Helicobacter sp.]|nr:transcription-repair coupling factor [Helicobacter sp.]